VAPHQLLQKLLLLLRCLLLVKLRQQRLVLLLQLLLVLLQRCITRHLTRATCRRAASDPAPLPAISRRG
jgi:hypothetical protein